MVCHTIQNGNKYWYQDGYLHRDDGPAIEHINNGYKQWCQYGKVHRDDGPAVVWPWGEVEYWINDKQLSDEEFKLYKFVNNL